MPRVVRPEFTAYSADLALQLAANTGYSLRVVEDDALVHDSEMRLPRADQMFIEIAYQPSYRSHAAHFCASSLLKALRFYNQPPDQRVLPVVEVGRGLPEEEYADLRRRVPAGADAYVHALSVFLYEGLVRQLTSMPCDLRVEREIQRVPEHREAQRRYLAQQVKDLEPHFSPEIARFALAKTYRASSSMNVALGLEASEISEVPPGPIFLQNPHRQLGERLREHLHAEPLHTEALGDRKVTDAWATELELEGWYAWERV